MNSAPITSPQHALTFLLAGNAYATLVSERTNERFTFRVVKADKKPGDTREPPHFVSVLTSPDVYTYMGVIFGGKVYSHGRKSKITSDAPSAKAFAWFWKNLSSGYISPACQLWHEGRCGRCGRRLTVPESIDTGMGPECAKKTG